MLYSAIGAHHDLVTRIEQDSPYAAAILFIGLRSRLSPDAFGIIADKTMEKVSTDDLSFPS